MTPKPVAPPDRRVRRTRHQLRDALIALIAERGWDSVSVTDVCTRADVGRSTFYVHFADKEELLLSGYDELHALLAVHQDAAAGTFAFAEALIEHARDNMKLFRALVGRPSGQVAQRGFRDLVQKLVVPDLEALIVDPARRGSAGRFISGGFVELLFAWLEAPRSTTAVELASTFQRLTHGVVWAANGAVPARRA